VIVHSERFRHDHWGGSELHALCWGDAASPPLVLLHGGGANAHWWDHVAPRIACRFRVVALDFRGHGDSDYPENRVVGGFNDDVESLLEHLGRRDVVLVGHSMGAHVALDHAARHRETRGLVLIDPSRGAERRARRSARLALFFRRSHPTREDAVSRFRFLPPSDHAAESLRRAIAEHSVRRQPDGRFGYKFDAGWFALPARPAPDVGAVECPTLVLRGGESDLLTRAGAEDLVRELRYARLVEVTGSGHHVQLDRPETLVGELRHFLAGIKDTHQQVHGS
jgi:pimeloyl-ACP methyl ester carboxylesterase